MRTAQKNNRSRGRGNRKGGGGGNIVNRVYDSAGPEGKVRGTPQQIIEKYLSLARDAQTTGDRVMSENFLQHAEHYTRLLMQATAQQEQNRRDQGEGGQDYDDEREHGQHGQQFERRGQAPQYQPQQRQDEGTAGPEEIGGMTTIDSGPSGGDDLLVVSEESGQSQPRRNGDGRRRRQRRDRDGGQDGGDAGTQEAERVENEGRAEERASQEN